MPDTSALPAQTALKALQNEAVQRIRLALGGSTKFTYDDVSSLSATFAANPQAAFDYIFNLVAAAPNDNPQLTLLLPKVIAEDYKTKSLGGRQYERLTAFVQQPEHLRPAGTDSFIHDAAHQLRVAVEGDLVTIMPGKKSWTNVRQRSDRAMKFLVPFVHDQLAAGGQRPQLQSYTRTRDEAFGHMMFIAACWEHKPELWGRDWAHMLFTTLRLRHDNHEPFTKTQRAQGRNWIAALEAKDPYSSADVTLDMLAYNGGKLGANPMVMANVLHSIEPLIYACDFDMKNRLGLKVDALTRKHIGPTVPKHERHAPQRRGLERITMRIHSHLREQFAKRDSTTWKPDPKPFELRDVRITMETHGATPYGPRVVPQSTPLLPLQQDALRVKAEAHRAVLRTTGRGFRTAMRRFDELAL